MPDIQVISIRHSIERHILYLKKQYAMFCEPTIRMELFFPAKGRFSFVTGSFGKKRLLTVLTPKAITNKFIRFASRALPRTLPIWRSLIIIWFFCEADYCFIKTSCDLINLLCSFVWKFLLPQLCNRTSRLARGLRHRVGGFQEFWIGSDERSTTFFVIFCLFQLEIWLHLTGGH